MPLLGVFHSVSYESFFEAISPFRTHSRGGVFLTYPWSERFQSNRDIDAASSQLLRFPYHLTG